MVRQWQWQYEWNERCARSQPFVRIDPPPDETTRGTADTTAVGASPPFSDVVVERERDEDNDNDDDDDDATGRQYLSCSSTDSVGHELEPVTVTVTGTATSH